MSGPRILVIDDDVELCNILTVNLNLLGYDCISSTVATEAIEILKNKEFDLVICDYVMPVMNGMELFEKISSLTNTLPPFLFYSGLIDVPFSEPYPRGIIGFLPKPFILEAFIEILPENLRPVEC